MPRGWHGAPAVVSPSPVGHHATARTAPADLQKLANTSSIVAYESAIGDPDAVVQSKFPSAGGVLPWCRVEIDDILRKRKTCT